MDYSTIKGILQDTDRNVLEDALSTFGEDVVEAAYMCDIQIADIGEAYQGQFSSDKDFVQDLLENTGCLPKDLPTFIHIDWERTASDIMMDYSEHDGHYFRNL